MDSSHLLKNQLDQARSVYDLQGLDNLRRGAIEGDSKALEKTAQQFEAIFISMMLKSMRSAEDVLADENSPFNSQQVKFYRDMHDKQLASDLAGKGSLGLAELIVQQLDPQGSGVIPASIARPRANLDELSFPPNRDEHSSEVSLNSGKATKSAAFESQEDFINTLMPAAEKAAQSIGLDAKALLAQAALETGWGKYLIHSADGKNSHNLFGIKAGNGWQGDKNVVDTLEFNEGVAKQERASFRAYDSFSDAMQDYVQFVKENPRYQEALQKVTEPAQYFDSLQKAGYATDPDYAGKVMSVLKDKLFNFTSYSQQL